MTGLWGTYIGNIVMTVLISMIPVVELRGAIPIAVANGLGIKTALIAAVAGNLVPVPLIILFVRRVFAWLREKSEALNRLVLRFEEKARRKSKMVFRYAWLGLVLLVAVPLPGTGAWTGALVAAMLDMRLLRAFPAIALGVILAGIIVSYITYGASVLLMD
jgi:uncharacterized membrane protein